ncbi:RICIN domain-containing protein [Streptomyces anulatus]
MRRVSASARLRLTVGALGFGALLVGLASAPASAAAPIGTFKQSSTGRCLDSNTAGEVYTRACNNGNYQKWELYPGAVLKNVATGRCLDSNAAGKVYTLACNTGDYQRWKGEAGQLQNRATSKCLDATSSGGAFAVSCYGARSQIWNRV